MKSIVTTITFFLSLTFTQFQSFGLNTFKDTTKAKICDYKKYYFANGKVQEEGCLLNGKKEGLWKEYNKNGWVRFEWTYFNDVLNGPYKSFYESGKINSVGYRKDGVPSDTVKFYEEDGILFKLEVWKVIDKNKSEMTYQKFFDESIKSNGTTETIKGKKYIWVDGKKIEMP